VLSMCESRDNEEQVRSQIGRHETPSGNIGRGCVLKLDRHKVDRFAKSLSPSYDEAATKHSTYV